MRQAKSKELIRPDGAVAIGSVHHVKQAAFRRIPKLFVETDARSFGQSIALGGERRIVEPAGEIADRA